MSKKRPFQYSLRQLFALLTMGVLFYGIFQHPIHYVCDPANWRLQFFVSPFYVYYWSMGFEWPYKRSIVDLPPGPIDLTLLLLGAISSFVVAGCILGAFLNLFYHGIIGKRPPWDEEETTKDEVTSDDQR